MIEIIEPIGQFRLEQLNDEIAALGIAGYLVTVVIDDTAKVVFDGTLSSQDEQSVRDAVAAHAPVPSIAQILAASKRFAIDLMDRWGVTIMSDGLIGSGQEHVVGVTLSDATILAQTGNLHGLDDELAAITPIAIYLEQSRINAIRNEVRAYLDLPAI